MYCGGLPRGVMDIKQILIDAMRYIVLLEES
jgi:hypothetical protein